MAARIAHVVPGGLKRPQLRFRILISALICLYLAGCGSNRPVFEETDEPDYIEGKSLLRQGEEEQALLAFLKVIDSRTDSPESHLEAGLLYLDEMNQPILAIYHFMKFLELRPDARQAPEVEGLIDTAKKEFARTLPGQPFENRSQQADLLLVVERLRAENERLKADQLRLERANRELRRRLGEIRENGGSTGTGTTSAEQGDQEAVYVVQPGDTLTSIARRLYGSSNRWEEIFAANRDLLRSPNDLRVGQELQIPAE